MSRKKKRPDRTRKLIPKGSAEKPQTTQFINREAAFLKSQSNQSQDDHPVVCLTLVHHDWECFSSYSRGEMKAFWKFQNKVSKHTWEQVFRSGGKQGSKTGLGYTKIGRDQYPGEYLKENISPDVAIFELRVNKKARVHGFRSGDIFYICFLDKEHRITGN